MTAAPSAVQPAAHQVTYLNKSYTFRSWLLTTDHKRIAFFYLLVVSGFAALGGTAAMLLKFELLTPQQQMFQDIYARLFTMHGGVMVYLFILPAMLGIVANFVIPLMIGAPNMAFPRLNLLTFYLYLFGSSMIIVEASFGGSDAGWNFLAPYSTQYTPSRILPALSLLLIVGIAVFLLAVNILATIHRRRVKGMDWEKLPLTVWGFYVASIAMIVGAFFLVIWIVLTATVREIALGYVQYNLNLNPLVLVHSFWIYAHTTVYMLMLPAIGIAADIIETFARRPVVGRKGVEHSMMTLAVLMSLSWGVHLFTGEMWAWTNLFFSLVAFLSAIPLAIIIISLFQTLRRGRASFVSPMVYAFGVLVSLAIYWASSLALYSPATAQALLHTQFEMANFHFLMVGVVTMSFLAAIHYWWPKATGKRYPELLARLAGWSTLLGVLGTFGPGFLLGLQGMRVRVVAYPEAWQMPNQLAGMSAMLIGLGFTLPLLYFLYAIFWCKDSGPNPWDASGLEWQTMSPPPPDNFTAAPLISERS